MVGVDAPALYFLVFTICLSFKIVWSFGLYGVLYFFSHLNGNKTFNEKIKETDTQITGEETKV